MRNLKRAIDIFGNAINAIDFGNPFGQRAKHGAIVHLLKSLAVPLITGHLTNEKDHRGRVLKRDMHPRRGIGCPRTARHKGHTRLAIEFPTGLCHHGCATFLTRDDIGNASIIEPIQRRQKAFARHTKNPLYALTLQCFNKHLATVFGLSHDTLSLDLCLCLGSGKIFACCQTVSRIREPLAGGNPGGLW